MPSPKTVTAVFDIGKSNKKFLLFDQRYAVIEKIETQLQEIADDDGDPCEDMEELESWIKSQFQKAEEQYPIKALNFSAYGASFVHIDQDGEPVTPLYNYLKKYPEELSGQFYNSVGGKEKFSIETASPPMGMLNSGLQLYWLKHNKPELFKKIDISLHLPNYLSYLFTKKKVSELTSIGCHTGLWNFKEMDYHLWLEEECVEHLLVDPQSVTHLDEVNDTKIGPGIHDSSAALAPYLLGLNDPFMLISTGTWSITLNPFNEEPLTYEELQKDCLCYLDIYGNQVKASRLFLGAEYSHQMKRISQHFSVRDHGSWMNLDVNLLNILIQNQNQNHKLVLEKAHNSGPFSRKQPGQWEIGRFSSAGEAYHQLMLDLVSIQVESIKLAEGSANTDQIIVSGGFSKNDLFVSLLTSFLPEKHIYTSGLSDASALGAAMIINEDSATASHIRNDFNVLLGLNKINKIDGLNLYNYSWV